MTRIPRKRIAREFKAGKSISDLAWEYFDYMGYASQYDAELQVEQVIRDAMDLSHLRSIPRKRKAEGK